MEIASSEIGILRKMNRDVTKRYLLFSWGKKSSSGYTLIEILIVIVIISIVAAFAVLTIGHNQNKKIESLGKEIANMIELAEEQAMLQPALLSFSVQNNSYQFNQYQPLSKSWRPITDSLLGKHIFSGAIQVSLHNTAQENEEKNFMLIITPSGDITPFVILIGSKNKAPSYQIIGTAQGDITQGWIHEK